MSIATCTIELEDNPNFADPDKLIRNFGAALDAMRQADQKLSVELQLPAHVWLMLADVAERQNRTIGDYITDMIFASPELRAEWIKHHAIEAETLPEIIRLGSKSGALSELTLKELRAVLKELEEGKAVAS